MAQGMDAKQDTGTQKKRIKMVFERIQLEDKELLLLGTAHVSSESRKLVEKIILEEKPDVVAIELDKRRLDALEDEGKKFSELNVEEVIKTNQTWMFLANVLLKNFQKEIGRNVGELPGSEMKAALHASKENGIPYALVDRDIQITMKRAYEMLGIVEKIKLGSALIAGMFGEEAKKVDSAMIEKLKEKDTLNAMMHKLGEEFPTIQKVVVDERDLYIAQKLREIKAKKVLAVVGAGHVPGIEKYIRTDHDIRPIEIIPKKPSILPLLGWVFSIAVLAIFGYAFLTKGIEGGLTTLALWFLVNGSLSALGTLLAGGHILAAATAFIAAPFTTLHPLLAAGWFAGLAQARLTVPQIKDFDSLSELKGISDFQKNKITRILLVTAGANIGAMVGSLVAVPWILSNVLK